MLRQTLQLWRQFPLTAVLQQTVWVGKLTNFRLRAHHEFDIMRRSSLMMRKSGEESENATKFNHTISVDVKYQRRVQMWV